jgi:DNA-binding IclR family transcriptional regulator
MRFLAYQSKPFGVNAVAREVGLSPSSCFNILKTLVAEGVLEFDERDKGYFPGANFQLFARTFGGAEIFYRAIEPDLAIIAKKFRCTVSFWEAGREGRVILVGSVQGAPMLNVQMKAGLRLPPLLGAMGRCVAAHSGWERSKLERAFEKVAWQNPPPFRTFLKDAATVKRTGWAIDIDNYMKGITTVASAVLATDGQVRYCVANILLTGSLTSAELKDLRVETAKLGAVLTQRLARSGRR